VVRSNGLHTCHPEASITDAGYPIYLPIDPIVVVLIARPAATAWSSMVDDRWLSVSLARCPSHLSLSLSLISIQACYPSYPITRISTEPRRRL